MTKVAQGPALDVDAIRTRAEAATPGPWVARANPPVWVADGVDPGEPGWEIDVPSPQDLSTSILDASGEFSEADASFIVHARDDVPALLAECVRLEALFSRWRTYAVAMRDQDAGNLSAPQRFDVKAAWIAVCEVDAEANAERVAADAA